MCHRYGAVSGFIESPQPLHTLCSDITGPFDATHFLEHGKFFIIAITDVFTRYTLFSPVIRIRSQEVICAIEKWFKKFGKPAEIFTDNGTQYSSTEFRKFCMDNNIKHKQSSVFNPTGNAVSERVNKRIV